MYRPLPHGLVVRKSDRFRKITGNDEESGLFATQNISAGTRLGITHVVTNRPEFDNCLIRTPLGGFFNHDSNNPNCQVTHQGDLIYLETIEEINIGDELTAKYTLYNPENSQHANTI